MLQKEKHFIILNSYNLIIRCRKYLAYLVYVIELSGKNILMENFPLHHTSTKCIINTLLYMYVHVRKGQSIEIVIQINTNDHMYLHVTECPTTERV